MKDENGNDVPTENIGDDTTEAGGTTGTQSNRTPPKSTSAPKP